MKKGSLLSVLLVITLIFGGCSTLMPYDITEPDSPGVTEPELDKDYYKNLTFQEGNILVKPENFEKLDEVISGKGSTILHRWETIEWAKISIPEGETELSFMEKMNKNEKIVFAEPVLEYEIPPYSVVDDPKIGDPEPPRVMDIQDEIGAECYDLLWGMQQINVEPVWVDITTGEEDVIVAIVDTGLKGHYEEFTGINFVGAFDATTGGDDVTDLNGHGTHVTGTAVSDGRSGKLAGVAWDTAVMPIKVMDEDGIIWTTYLIDAMEHLGNYAKEEAATIVANMSIGGRGYSLAFKDAIDYAAGEDVLLVTSAGNASKRVLSYPSAYNGVLSVGATNAQGEKAEFSTEGWWNSVAAPGEKILSAYIGFDGDEIYDTYAFLQGTSMAAPHVTGAVALLLSNFGSMDTVEIINRVQSTANAEEFTEKFGYGILDAHALITDNVEPRYGSLEVKSDIEYGVLSVFDEEGNLAHFGATGTEKSHTFHIVDPGEYEVTLSYNYQIRAREIVQIEVGEVTEIELLAFED